MCDQLGCWSRGFGYWSYHFNCFFPHKADSSFHLKIPILHVIWFLHDFSWYQSDMSKSSCLCASFCKYSCIFFYSSPVNSLSFCNFSLSILPFATSPVNSLGSALSVVRLLQAFFWGCIHIGYLLCGVVCFWLSNGWFGLKENNFKFKIGGLFRWGGKKGLGKVIFWVILTKELNDTYASHLQGHVW